MGSGPSSKAKKKKFSITQISEKSDTLCFDDFQILRAIGKGSFGKVCIVQKKDTLKMYAMKYMNKNQCIEKDAFKNVLREIEILTKLEHPFLVNLWFTFQDEEDMFMVVDLLLGGDLRYHLQQGNTHFDESRITLYICEIGLALDYLCSKRIVHRDIKPDNILLDDIGHAHIADFNIATTVKEGELVTSVSGTKPYMAPEVVLCALDRTEGYTFAADWWSLGVTAYELFCRKRPYDISSGSTIEEIRDIILNTCVRFPKAMHKKAASLVRKLLSVDPRDRISSVEHLKRHPYLENMDFEAVAKNEVAPSFTPNKKQLNCDPTFELEEMIIESRPLHKKKKRLSKKNRSRSSMDGEEMDSFQKCLDAIEQSFIIYNRESALHKRKMAEKEKIWEEELKKVLQ